MHTLALTGCAGSVGGICWDGAPLLHPVFSWWILCLNIGPVGETTDCRRTRGGCEGRIQSWARCRPGRAGAGASSRCSGCCGAIAGNGDPAQGLLPVFRNHLTLRDPIWVTGSYRRRGSRMGWSHPIGREALSAKGLERSSIACS